ncbi:MAG: ComF family protein [Deltaproteobacteria bacterium]|nr:ComF family protein [Deltaproteobacteria bacterium]
MILRDGLSFVARSLSALFFPRTCSFCDSLVDCSGGALCGECYSAIKWVTESVCDLCGRPFPGISAKGPELCGSCLSSELPYDKVRYAAHYEGELRKAIVRFKYYGGLYVADALGQVLMEAFFRNFGHADFDLIVPVPIHRKRLVSRGFNQAVVLADKLSHGTGIGLDRISLCKIKDTPPQVGLSRRERIENLRGTLAVCREHAVRNKSVLLVDDVATSGATIREASKTLKKAGATRVGVLVLALRSLGGPETVVTDGPVETEESS